MKNVWTNYYAAKLYALGVKDTATTGTGVLRRAEEANLKILDATVGSGGVFEAIDALGTLFTNINNAMLLINNMIDPTYGLVAGLNCLVFGEDFQRIQQIFCGSIYTNMYTMRLAIGIASYGVLFMMCCAVCTGVRHFKHAERKGRVGDAFFNKSGDEGSGALFVKKN